MGASKLKSMICSVSVLSAIWLVGCAQKAAEPAASVQAGAASASVNVAETPSSASALANAEDLNNTGLFAGKFDPAHEYLVAQMEYEKWTRVEAGDGDFQGSRDLNDTPEKFRAYMYQHPLYGYYDFIAPNRMSITIDEIAADGSFIARSVAAGNERLVTGKWKKLDYGWYLSGAEPGDNANDGKFEMILTRSKLIGTWTPNNPEVAPKDFSLVKTYFAYDPKIGQGDDGRYYVDLGRSGFEKNPSIAKLESADVENLKQPTLRMIRNLIFARHGYSFAKKDLRLVFEAYDWYTPVSNDVKDTLTQIEKDNLKLIARYEEYADKHYDEYGR
jgi:hypothetical protein